MRCDMCIRGFGLRYNRSMFRVRARVAGGGDTHDEACARFKMVE